MAKALESLVSAKKAAGLIGSSHAWVRRECRLRGFGRKIEGRYLIAPDEVDKLKTLVRPVGRPVQNRKKT